MGIKGPNAKLAPTFRTIAKRLSGFNITLTDHLLDNPRTIADLEVHPLTLQGVDFTVKDADAFLAAVREARTGSDKAFSEGSTKGSDWKQHWAMTASLQATHGIGFREPWRYYLNDRTAQLQDTKPPLLNAPEMDRGLSAHFGEANTLNLTALHISVAFGKWTECNIHIDETGIGMKDLQNNLTITPNVVHHLFNELLLKTFAGEALGLPTWVLDRFNLHVLSPEMAYERVGISVDVLKGESYKLTISASCGLTSCKDIDVSRIFSADVLKGLGGLNPTVGFEKRW
jgi:hypothetical protein